MARWTTMPQLEFPVCAHASDWCLIAAGGGLLYFGANAGVLVCNPMTKAWRELPEMSLKKDWVITHMVVDECRSAYKILLPGVKGDLDIYDLVANKWIAVEPLPPLLGDVRCRAYCNGKMYFLGKMLFDILGGC